MSSPTRLTKAVRHRSGIGGRAILQRKCACARDASRGTCPACAPHSARTAPAIVEDVRRAPGAPLEPPLRVEMESRFAHDFGLVRVHDDARSAASARALDADAYTVGSHVVFGRGLYSPGTEAGKHLLAHELAHVVQQAGRMEGGAIAVSDDAGLEQEAETAASRSIAGPLHAGAGLMRQGASRKRPADSIYTYGRANFQDRFSGEVDAANHRAVLIVRLELVDMGPEKDREGRIEAFAAKAVPIIQSAWSGKFALKSVCAADKFEASVRLVVTDTNPHHTVHVWPDAGERSNSTNWQANDLETEHRDSPVLIDPKKPPSPDNVRMMTFAQIPATHEFGHLIGLQHVACEGNADRCYGVTADQKLDIMGYGSDVSPKDYAPFQKIMERYGQDTQQPECNKWELVAPG